MQVLKEEIREAIINSALEEFYDKGFLKASIYNIANGTNISTGNIYRYFKNKEALLEAVLTPTINCFFSIMNDEDIESQHKEFVHKLSKEQVMEFIIKQFEFYNENLIKHRKEIIILIDKSQGTKFENFKEEWINLFASTVEEHLAIYYEEKTGKKDIRLARPFSMSFLEGYFEIYRKNTKKEDIIYLTSEYIRFLCEINVGIVFYN